MGTTKVKSGSKEGKVQYPYDAMVYIDGTIVYAIDKEGNVIKRGVAGTDDATVIQAAIDYLSGSSYMRYMKMIGNFVSESIIHLYGNICYTLDGKITLANGVDNTMLHALTQSNIIFEGGEIDGNKANNSVGHCLQFRDSSNITVKNLKIHDANTWGLATTNGTHDVILDNIYIYSCGGNNFHIGPEEFGTPLENYLISNCISDLSGRHGFEFDAVVFEMNNCIATNSVGYGFSLDLGCNHCHISNCKASGNGLSGFSIVGSTAYKNIFESCDSYDNGNHGIQVSYGGADIIGGSYFNNDMRGISLNCKYNTIIGARVYNNSQVSANVHQGINISSSDNTTISMCHVYDDQGSPTQKYGISNYSLGVLITNNRLWGNATSQIYDSTITTIYKDNIGYVNISELRDTLNNVLELLGDVRLLLPQAEITGTSITDYTRRANTTTASTSVATWYGYQGRATYYDFNGTSHYLYRTNDTDFDFGNSVNDSAFSVVVAINPDSSTSRFLIGKWDANNAREWRLFLDASGYPTLQLYDESVDKYIGRQDQTAFTTGSWKILVATYDGSGICAGCKVYIDGVQLDDADYTDAGYVAMEAVSANLMVGALKNAAAYSEYYDGKMTWIGIAAKELSADEVWSLTQRLKGVLGI